MIHLGKNYRKIKKALDISVDHLYSIINYHYERQVIKWSR